MEHEKFPPLTPEQQQALLKLNGVTAQFFHALPLESVVPVMIGFMANIVGPFADDAWQSIQLHAERPCGVRGCGCHIMGAEFYQALDKMRDDWKKNCALLASGQIPTATFTQL